MPPPRDQIERVLADIVKESLTAGAAIDVPGLGTFEVQHRSSTRIRLDNGEQKFTPPREEIVFTPEQ